MKARALDDRTLVRVLKALADEKRLRMVQAIARAGELSCGQVAALFELSQPTISHHLKLLSNAGLVLVRQEGQTHFISVDRRLAELVMGALPSRMLPARRRRRG